MNSSRDNILKKVREATAVPSQLPDIPDGVNQRLENIFTDAAAQNSAAKRKQFQIALEKVSGEFYYVKNELEAADTIFSIFQKDEISKISTSTETSCSNIISRLKKKVTSLEVIPADRHSGRERKQILAEIPFSLVEASHAIADIGSVVFNYEDNKTTLPEFLAECVIAIAHEKNLVANHFDFFNKVTKEQNKHMVFVTGPSRTADIEKLLFLGAHGPRRFIVVMLRK